MLFQRECVPVLFSVSLSVFASLLCFGLPAQADQYYDAGLKAFQGRKYADAAAYFEQSIKAAPWESNAFYYCALAYHYKGDFKNAIDKYGQCVERFPGTQACNQSMDALKVIDPGYFKRRSEAAKKDAGRIQTPSQGASSSAAASGTKDMGTVEGDGARVLFRVNGGDKVVDCFINGRSTRAIFDPNTEATSFSRQQLGSLAISPPKGAIEFRCDLKIGGITRRNFPITIDDGGLPAKIGTSFTDTFSVNVDESAKSIDIRKKGGGASGATSVGFSKDGKDMIVQVEVNGRGANMIFDPNGSGLSLDSKQAKGLGLKVDEAETQHHTPGEGPQRGEANWVPDEDRTPQPKLLAVRMKMGPCVQNGVTCKITETSTSKYPTFGADFITGGGYKFDIDYKSSRINLTRK